MIADGADEQKVVVLMHGRCSADELRAALTALGKTSGAQLRVLLLEVADGVLPPEELKRHDRLEVLARPSASDAVGIIRDALAGTPRADLAVLRAGILVQAGWHAALRSVAYSDSTTATATAIRGPAPRSARRADTAHRAGALDSPATLAPGWECTLLRREVIETALVLHEDRVPDHASLTAALDALVMVPGFVHRIAPVGISENSQAPRSRTDQKGAAPNAGARRILDLAESADEGLRVMIDLRCCAFPMSGTQIQALQLARALSSTAQLDLGVLLPETVDASVSAEVARLPASIHRYGISTLPSRRPHVFHCPYQLLADQDLGEALTLGDRLVITQQDMIMSHTPSYFRNTNDWSRFVDTTDTSFLAADHVAFFSPHAMTDALSDGVLSPEKASVIPIGTDHLSGSEEGFIDMPAARSLESGDPFLLVIGNAYAHKNRIHALQILTSLRRQERWHGMLVFAGGHPPVGGSARLERAYLSAHPEDSEHVIDLGPVTEGLKAWLYRHSLMVLYPTLYEGFGLVPFEAAAFGTATAYSQRSALGDFLPDDGALLKGWNADVNAERIADVLADPSAAQAIVAAVRVAGERLTWAKTARAYLDVYRTVVSRRPGLSLALGSLALGPAIATVTPTEQRVLKAYRRSRAIKLLLDSIVSTAMTGRRFAKPGRRLRRSGR